MPAKPDQQLPVSQGARELRPCAHCGHEASSFFHRDQGMGDSWHIECMAEDCGVGTAHCDTEAEAITAWNTRRGEREPAPSSERDTSTSVAEEWCAYMDEAVSKAPEPLRALGKWLSQHLDEDDWKTAERLLNAAVLTTQEPALDLHTLEEAAKVARKVAEKHQAECQAATDARASGSALANQQVAITIVKGIDALKGGEQ